MARLNIKKSIAVLAVIVLLIFFHYSKLLSPVESFFGGLLSPVARIFYSLGFNLNLFYQEQTAEADLAAELKDARETVNRLLSEQVDTKFLEEENALLRKQLNFLSKNQQPYLIANIISRGESADNDQESRTVLIDKGARDGLVSGLVALSSVGSATSSQAVVIGKIINVKDSLAEVLLVTNKNCRLAAAILGENKTSGIVSGELGLTIKMDFIPQTENIQVGDLVATSGLEQNIPRGLLIGQVTKVLKENNQVWQSATIEPQVDLNSIYIISVLLPQ